MSNWKIQNNCAAGHADIKMQETCYSPRPNARWYAKNMVSQIMKDIEHKKESTSINGSNPDAPATT